MALMQTIVELTFLIEPLRNHQAKALSLTPVISGTPLTQLVTDFEKAQGFKPSGGYAGIVPKSFSFGPLERYFNGRPESETFANGLLYLLGCSCGEVGCWPLLARIEHRGKHFAWHSFAQPHRPTRDYSQFGPFVFDESAYREAVREATSRFP